MTERIGLGGGCYWCTEAVFQSLCGVQQVAQGFIRSEPPDESFSEAVLVSFDPARITLADLIEIHVHTHSSTSQHALRNRYRSAVYTFNPKQAREASSILEEIQPDLDQTLITQVLPCAGFKPSPEKYHDYYQTRQGNPFCARYIDPKLNKLRHDYVHLYRQPNKTCSTAKKC